MLFLVYGFHIFAFGSIFFKFLYCPEFLFSIRFLAPNIPTSLKKIFKKDLEKTMKYSTWRSFKVVVEFFQNSHSEESFIKALTSFGWSPETIFRSFFKDLFSIFLRFWDKKSNAERKKLGTDICQQYFDSF